MSSHATTSNEAGAPLNLSRFRSVPMILIVMGVLGALGAFFGGQAWHRQFAYSYLFAFIFFLSLAVGCWFLVMIHHLFDAAWSVPLRRVAEHGMCLLPWMFWLFLPIAAMALFGGEHLNFYPWMEIANPIEDHALHAKEALLNKKMWAICSLAIFGIWWLWSNRLRYWSLRQDETGAPECTYKMRVWSCGGIVLFAISVTLGIILWVKSLEHEWFSTMYGVYYFAESVWTTLATMYVLMTVLRLAGPLKPVIKERQRYDLGVLWFAFTVFYAYIHFSQYFIIWNANIPEETWHYVLRENGAWYGVGMLIIFGHFFVPFLTLLRIDVKKTAAIMIPLAIWAWLMHFCDVSFNIGPILHPAGELGSFFNPLDLTCLAFVGGVLSLLWIKSFLSHPPFPLKDPRMAEALGVHQPPSSSFGTAESH
jgi:hypothetical protein